MSKTTLVAIAIVAAFAALFIVIEKTPFFSETGPRSGAAQARTFEAVTTPTPPPPTKPFSHAFEPEKCWAEGPDMHGDYTTPACIVVVVRDGGIFGSGIYDLAFEYEGEMLFELPFGSGGVMYFADIETLEEGNRMAKILSDDSRIAGAQPDSTVGYDEYLEDLYSDFIRVQNE